MNTAEAAIAGLFNQKGSGGGGSVAEAIISATSTTSPLTDSADSMVQGITVYGRSEVVEGEIKSVGEGYAVVRLADLTWAEPVVTENRSVFEAIFDNFKQEPNDTIAPNLLTANFQSVANSATWIPGNISNRAWNNSIVLITEPTITTVTDLKASLGDSTLCYELADPTQGNAIAVKTDDGTGVDGTMATFTTALPLRGVSDTVRDKLTCTAESKQVETVCGVVDLGDLTWYYVDAVQGFYAPLQDVGDRTVGICSSYELTTAYGISDMPDKTFMFRIDQGYLYVKDLSYSDPTTFKIAVTGVKLVYALATPTVTPLTSAEISAFRGLHTYDSTTNITISDEPDFEIDYLKNTGNGVAVADIQKDLQGQINGLAIKTLTYTGTGTTTNSITFPIKPMQVLGITQHEMESPYQDYHRSIIPFVYDSRSSTMLCQWVKNVDTSSTQYRGSMLYYLTINGNTMTWTAQDAAQAFNLENIEYTVYYI